MNNLALNVQAFLPNSIDNSFIYKSQNSCHSPMYGKCYYKYLVNISIQKLIRFM